MCNCGCDNENNGKIPNKYFDSRYLVDKSAAIDAKTLRVIPNSALDWNGYYSASQSTALTQNAQIVNYGGPYVVSKNGVKYFI